MTTKILRPDATNIRRETVTSEIIKDGSISLNDMDSEFANSINKLTNKTHVFAYSTQRQSISSGSWVKLTFNAIETNSHGMYNPVTSQFMANEDGIYLISSSVHFESPGAFNGTLKITMGIYINNIQIQLLSSTLGSNGDTIILNGSTPVVLKTGDMLDIRINANMNTTTYGGQTASRLSVVELS